MYNDRVTHIPQAKYLPPEAPNIHSQKVLTYYLTENDVRLIKTSLESHLNQCKRTLNSLPNEEDVIKVENKIKELEELLIGM